MKSRRRESLWAVLLLILTSAVIDATAQLGSIRIDPPHWWVNMPQPALQLMIHADNVAKATAHCSHQQVVIRRQTPGDSPNYLFLDLDVSDLKNSTQIELTLRWPDGTESSATYAFKERSGFSPLRIDSKDIIYLITPDRFANGDVSNDANPDLLEQPMPSDLMGRYGGDIQGIIDHVDYLHDFGFTAIWSSPLLENNQMRSSYHGYSITDHYRIDPRFGNLAKYIELSNSLRDRGMKLIMDIVPNHIGSNHWWMHDLPFDGWINHGEFKPTNHTRNTLHDPYAAKADEQTFQAGWFVESMPDLNQQHPHLATYLIQNAIWWVETAGLSGFRIDTYSYSDHDFIQTLVCQLRETFPALFIVGEEWSTEHDYVAYWQSGHPRNETSCLPSLMDFPMQQAIADAVRNEESWNSGLAQWYHSTSLDYQFPDPNQLVVFLDNHDMDRWFTAVNEDLDRWKMGMIALFTIRGIPQLYYGTEILMHNRILGHHGDIRAPFPGTWPQDTADAISGVGLGVDALEARTFLKNLIRFRAQSPAITDGSMLHFIPQNGIYAYLRQTEDQQLMVLFNKNRTAQSVPMDRFRDALNGAETGIHWNTKQAIDLNQPLVMPPMSALILELR